MEALCQLLMFYVNVFQLFILPRWHFMTLFSVCKCIKTSIFQEWKEVFNRIFNIMYVQSHEQPFAFHKGNGGVNATVPKVLLA